MKEKISLIIPCYNEEESLEYLYQALNDVMQKMENYDFEILFVNDGSTDNTLEVIKSFARTDERIIYLSFSRNFGKESAMYAGFCNATGSYVAIMDADMQDPPSLLPEMIQYLERGGTTALQPDVSHEKGNQKSGRFLPDNFIN